MKKIRVLIADDHEVVRSGLRTLLEASPDLTVIAEAADGAEAVALALRHSPDVVVLDLTMPKLNGIEATRRIRETCAEARVLILTIHEHEEYLQQIIAAGASGYLIKTAEKKELYDAIRTIAAGGRFFSPGISRMMIEGFIKHVEEQGPASPNGVSRRLTPREIEILRGIVLGMTSQQIADKLFISYRTVNTHRTNIMQKLDIHDTAGLVRYALQEGIVRS